MEALAGQVGIEPTKRVLEARVLPLNYWPEWYWNWESNPTNDAYETSVRYQLNFSSMNSGGSWSCTNEDLATTGNDPRN